MTRPWRQQSFASARLTLHLTNKRSKSWMTRIPAECRIPEVFFCFESVRLLGGFSALQNCLKKSAQVAKGLNCIWSAEAKWNTNHLHCSRSTRQESAFKRFCERLNCSKSMITFLQNYTPTQACCFVQIWLSLSWTLQCPGLNHGFGSINLHQSREETCLAIITKHILVIWRLYGTMCPSNFLLFPIQIVHDD